MALVLIDGPDNAPSTAADWNKVNDVLQTIGLDISNPTRIKDGYIHRGSVLFFAGAWYVADADTEITGVASDYVKLVNTDGVVTAEYVSELVDVTFNRTWNGWYDPDGNLYLFDELKAYGIGDTTEVGTFHNWFPSLNWSRALSRVLSASNLARFFRIPEEVHLTGTGSSTWTVPAGVYWVEGEIQAPGEPGSDGTINSGGNGGDGGRVIYFGFAVTPGEELSYTISLASTIFNGITALAGGGIAGGRGQRYAGGVSPAPGGNGGGYISTGGGKGGNGGQSGYTSGSVYTPPTSGGSGSAGGIKIR